MPGQRITVELDPGLDAPALARRLVTTHGAELDPALVADAVLCVSEVVTNAVQHGRPVITLCLDSRGGGLGVEVTDHGDPIDVERLVPAGDDSPRGRGLHIVAALSRAWGVRTGTSTDDVVQKTVWFDLHPTAPGADPAARPA